VAGLDAAGKSKRTSALTLFVVRAILGQALDDGVVVRNVATKVEAPGVEAKPRHAFSAADVATLRQYAAGDPLHACWLLSLAGLRRSEILGLRWTDLDAASGALVIERSVTPDASGRRGAPGGTKTRRGARTLPLPPDVHAALRPATGGAGDPPRTRPGARRVGLPRRARAADAAGAVLGLVDEAVHGGRRPCAPAALRPAHERHGHALDGRRRRRRRGLARARRVDDASRSTRTRTR
jgi:integrase